MALKQLGLFRYACNALNGGGVAVAFDLFVTDDAGGDHLGEGPAGQEVMPVRAGLQSAGGTPSAQQPATSLAAWFVPTALGAGTSNAGRMRVVLTTTNNGASLTATRLTGLVATLTNDSPGAGDTLTGFVYVLVTSTADAG